MSGFATWAVVVVAACTAVYTLVRIVREQRRYNQQREALERWFAAQRTAQEEGRDKWQ